jgi:hypothetical protein
VNWALIKSQSQKWQDRAGSRQMPSKRSGSTGQQIPKRVPSSIPWDLGCTLTTGGYLFDPLHEPGEWPKRIDDADGVGAKTGCPT